ncbi:MAG: hypothetical protein ACP6IS_08510 [Candidatus Asgardarchaeia archaeon]
MRDNVNVTFSFPRELYKKMKIHKEVNWSEVVRKAVSNHLKMIEIGEKIIPMKELSKRLKEVGLNMEEVSLEEAEKYYKEMREKEWKRTSTTQTS